MKRAHRFAAVLALCAVILTAVLLWGAHRSLSLSKGTCLIAEDGTCLLLLDNSPTVLANRTEREDAFADLKTGDSLLVLHDGIQETYPARTGVYAVYKLSGGGTVPQQVIDDLSALGWTICGAEPTTVVLSGGALTDTAVSWANYSDSPALWAAALAAAFASFSSASLILASLYCSATSPISCWIWTICCCTAGCATLRSG